MSRLTTKLPVLAACICFLFDRAASAQSFVNGDMETNTASLCHWNMNNSSFNSLMTGITAFGAASEVDIQEATCSYASPQSGNYFLSIHQQASGITDEISFALTAPLIAGNTYAIRYYDQANVTWDGIGNVEIGISNSPASFGTVLYSSTPVTGSWSEHEFTFTAPITGSYITARVRNELPSSTLTGWTFIDNFSLTCPSADLGNDLVLCEGDSVKLNIPVMNASFSWHDGSTASTYTVTQPGAYWVEIDFGNCKASDQVIVTGSNIQFSLGNDTVMCSGQSLLLEANVEQASYKWHDGSDLKTCSVKGPGTYWVTVISNGCSRSDTITIDEKDCSSEFEMPNVFTPNGDGVNDMFKPLVMKNIISGSFVICNRWGEQMFAAHDPAAGWDGSSKGSLCSAGIYFWIAEYTNILGESTKLTGTLTLLR